MNKHSLKHLLLFISCLFLAYSCVSEEDLLQTDKTEQAKQTFSIFSNSQNIQGKSSKSAIDYAKGFSILMQRYDSIHNTNISGLVNTNNKVEHKKKSHQNVIIENKDYYIETRLHSQVITENNGNKYVIFPLIKNNKVDKLIVGVLSKDDTYLSFYKINEIHPLYEKNINLFQNTFSKSSTKQSKSTDPLCGEGDDVCEMEEVVIVVSPNPIDWPIYNPWAEGDCVKFNNCTSSGGGGDLDSNNNIHIYNETDLPPSCKSFDFVKVNSTFQEAGVINIGQIFLARTPSGKSATIGLYIGELYFNLPVTRSNGEFYSTGRAAKISAEALGKAFKSTDSYFKQNPFATNINIELNFLNNLRVEMSKYGGTVSKTPSQGSGYKPVMKDFRNYWFIDEPSCWN